MTDIKALYIETTVYKCTLLFISIILYIYHFYIISIPFNTLIIFSIRKHIYYY